MNKDSLKGTGKVYAFTLRQLLKNKSNIITFSLFCLIAVFTTPVACLILGGMPDNSSSTTVYINNETQYALDTSDFDGSPFRFTEKSGYFDALGDNELAVHIRAQGDDISIQIIKPTESAVSDFDVEAVRSDVYDLISAARFSYFGVSQAQLDILMADYTLDVFDESEYDSAEIGFAASYSIQYAYAVVLIIICMFTVIYIIRAVVEEKASKLVELLMTSVEPLALLVGKILAAMTFIFGMLLAIALLSVLSYSVSGAVLDTSPIIDMIHGRGINPDVLNINPVALISVLISLILAYMTFSIIAGLLGATCSSTDDVSAVNMYVTFLVMGGYVVSVFVSASGIDSLAVVGSLVPVISAFVAPVQYILGGIGIVTLAVSWIIQLAAVAALAVFSARVYRGLIMHGGSRVKFKTLLLMCNSQAEREAQ